MKKIILTLLLLTTMSFAGARECNHYSTNVFKYWELLNVQTEKTKKKMYTELALDNAIQSKYACPPNHEMQKTIQMLINYLKKELGIGMNQYEIYERNKRKKDFGFLLFF